MATLAEEENGDDDNNGDGTEYPDVGDVDDEDVAVVEVLCVAASGVSPTCWPSRIGASSFRRLSPSELKEREPQKPLTCICSERSTGGSGDVQSAYVSPSLLLLTSPARLKETPQPSTKSDSFREKGVPRRSTEP